MLHGSTVMVPNSNGELLTELTWDHFDGSVDLFPVLSMLKLPVEDEVTVIGHHRALKQ